MGRGRAPCCQKVGLNRGTWTREEDVRLIDYIVKYGHENWRTLPKLAGLLRCGKSCRLRWINYLRPGIKRGNFTKEEEDTIIELHELLGNKWSKIAACLPGRTDNEIKNVWNTHLRKRRNPGNASPPPPATLVDKLEDSLLSSPSSAVTSISLSSLDKIEIPVESQFDVGAMLDDAYILPEMEVAAACEEDSIHGILIDDDLCDGVGGPEKGWRWLADLEVELGLLDGGGSCGGNEGGGDWKERLVGGGGDPVECYFHSRWPSPPSLQKS